MGKDKLTSRGGAVNQDKNWSPVVLATQTRFIHAGAAPLASKGGTGLLLSYAKEDIKVAGHPTAPKKYILAFPFTDFPPGTPLPETIKLSKPQELLWDINEMPHVFIFTLDAGVKLWTQEGKFSDTREVGIPFDVKWKESLVAEYQRINKNQARVVY
jgi:hypothetical protein